MVDSFVKEGGARESSKHTLTSTVDRGAQHVIVGPDVLHAAVAHLVVLLLLGEQAVALGTRRGLQVGEAGRAAGAIDQGVLLGHRQLVLLLCLRTRLHHILVVQCCL